MSTTRETGTVIGNGLKSIFSRITTMSEAESALKSVNVSIKDMGGNVKPVSIILSDLADKWTSLSDEQRQNIGVTIAGRFQLTRFLALMNNWKLSIDATKTSLNSQGSSMKEQEKYANSLQARLNRLDTAWNKLTMSFGGAFLTDGIISLVETFNDLATASSKIVDYVGVLSGVFGILGVTTVALSSKVRGFATALIFGTESLTGTALATTGLTAEMGAAEVATTGFKVALRGLGAATVVGLAFVALGYAIEKLIGYYSKVKQEQEAFDKSQQKGVDALTKNKKETEGLIDTYNRLTASRKLQGDSWNYKSEQGYLQVQQKLADLYPQLISYVDAAGNKHIKSKEQIDKEIKSTERLIQLKKDETKINAGKTFEKDIKDRTGFFGIDSQLEGKKELLKYQQKRGMRDEVINKTKLEIEQLSQSWSDLAQKTSNDVLKVSDSYSKLKIDPTIKQGVDDFISSLDFSKLDKTQLENYSQKIGTLTDRIQKAYNSGDSDKFDKAKEALIKYAISVNATKLQADGFDITFDKVVKAIEQASNVTYYGAEGMDAYSDSLDGVMTHSEELVKNFKDSISNIETLNGVIKELNDNHSLSSDTLTSLMEKYPELLAYIGDESTLRSKINDKIDEETATANKAMLVKLSTSEDFYKKVFNLNKNYFKALSDDYNVDLSKAKSLAVAKEIIEDALLKKLTSKWSKYYDAQSDVFTSKGQQLIKGMGYQEAINNPMLKDIGNARTELEKTKKKFDDLAISSSGIDALALSTSGLADESKKNNKETENSIYVADNYKLALEALSTALERINSIKDHAVKGSKEYQDALKSEIDLLKQQKSLQESQAKDLQTQINSGVIKKTGVITVDDATSSSSSGGNYSGKYQSAINQAALANSISPALIAAIIKAESGFNPNAKSGAGAMGLMQLMPGTARGLGVTNALDPTQNIMGGAKYIKQMLDMYNGDLQKALAAYNAGAGNVNKYGGVPPFAETQNYVKKVLGYYAQYGNGVGATSTPSKSSKKASKDDANNQQAIAEAKIQVQQLLNDALKAQQQIEEAQLEIIKAPMYQAENRYRQIDSQMKILQAQEGKMTLGSKEYEQNLKNQNKLLEEKKNKISSVMMGINKELTSNKNLTNYQKEALKSLYLDLRDQLVEFDNSIVENINKKTAGHIASIQKEYSDKNAQSDYALNLEKEKAKTLKEGSKEYYSNLNNQSFIIKQKIKNANDEKAAIDKLLKSEKLDAAQKEELRKQYKDLNLAVASLNNELADVDNAVKDSYNKIADQAIEAEKAYYEQRRKDQNDYYDAEKKKISDTYQAKIDAIDKQENATNYSNDLSKMQKDAQDIQKQINKQKLDDSKESKDKVIALEKTLADKRQEIADFQHKHEVDSRKDSLQEQQKIAEDAVDAEKKKWDDYYGNLLDDDRHWAAVREEIMKGNTKALTDELGTFATDVKTNMEGIGTSIQNNLLDKIKEASDALADINGKSASSQTATPSTPSTPSTGDSGSSSGADKKVTGHIEILKDINLWKRENGKLTMVRVLHPHEKYNVYGEDDKFGGQYNVGAGMWVTKMSGYIKRYHDGGIVDGKGNRLTELANKLFNTAPNEQTVVALKGELFAPGKNMPNFFANLGSFANSLIPKGNIASNTIQIDNLINIDHVDNNTDIRDLVRKTTDELMRQLKPYGFIR